MTDVKLLMLEKSFFPSLYDLASDIQHLDLTQTHFRIIGFHAKGVGKPGVAVGDNKK